MNRNNKRQPMKNWNRSSRRKNSERDRRVKAREHPRRKNWSAEPFYLDELNQRFA